MIHILMIDLLMVYLELLLKDGIKVITFGQIHVPIAYSCNSQIPTKFTLYYPMLYPMLSLVLLTLQSLFPIR